jgi:hypothetical protein
MLSLQQECPAAFATAPVALEISRAQRPEWDHTSDRPGVRVGLLRGDSAEHPGDEALLQDEVEDDDRQGHDDPGGR